MLVGERWGRAGMMWMDRQQKLQSHHSVVGAIMRWDYKGRDLLKSWRAEGNSGIEAET